MGNSELKEYIVTLHKHEDLDSFYEDMETPGGNLYIPDRAVEVVNRRPISRNTHYWLTAEEAIQLKNDPRVWDVSLTPEELGLVSVPGWTDTNGYYSKDIVTTANDKNWGLLRGFDRDHISGWGSDGATKVRTSTLNSKLNGTNVDFVIRGYTVDSAAPEFAVNADGTGGTRYFYVNWGDYGLGSTYTQAALTNDRSGAHETICGSIAFGNTQGWSRKARFTSIPNITSYYDYVRAWHQAKSVNPDTGFKNPTVVTDSYGGNYGIDATAITSITYRGTTYNGPFTTSTDFSQYKLWLNNSGETLYNQPDGRVVFSYSSAANLADIEDLVAAGVIFVGVSHNWRAYHAVENDQDWNNSITFGGGAFYYNQGLIASARGAIQAGAIMDLAANTPSPRSGRGPRVNVWAPSRTTGYSFYAGETPDGTGLGYEGGVQTDPASQGYLPMVKNSRDPRDSNYYIVKTTDGTSFSAPQVAGVIGLWAELKPDLTPAQALTLLQTYGDSTGVVSTSNNYGDPTSLAGATALALGFSSPTFSITANKSSLKPTDVITYTISTTNVPTGSTLYLVESGTSVAGDFVDGLTQIAVTTTGDSTTLSRTVSGTFTGSKTSILQVKTGGYNGTVQATASFVALITTTTTTTTTTLAPSSVTLTANTTSVVEGQAIRFTLTTTRIGAGNVYPYAITGVSSNDIFLSPPLTGNIVVGEPNIPRKTNVGTRSVDWVFNFSRSIFSRDKYVLVADEIYWNELSPTGAALKAKVDMFRAEDPNYELGVVVTPYTFFPVQKATETTVIADIVSSGVDFVALDPYFFKDPSLEWTTDGLYNWTVSFRDKLLNLGIKVFLVVQGFARRGSEIVTNEYNDKLLKLKGIDEFIIFGYEDGQDLIASGQYVSLSNDFGPLETKTNLDFVIDKDFKNELTESFTLSLTGPGRTESVTVFVDDKIFVPNDFNQQFIRFFN